MYCFRSTVASLEHAVNSLKAEKDTITSDHQLLMLGQHQHETRSLELTNQITVMAHERENMEAKLRQISKQFDEKQQAYEKLLDKSRHCETEKQVHDLKLACCIFTACFCVRSYFRRKIN